MRVNQTITGRSNRHIESMADNVEWCTAVTPVSRYKSTKLIYRGLVALLPALRIEDKGVKTSAGSRSLHEAI